MRGRLHVVLCEVLLVCFCKILVFSESTSMAMRRITTRAPGKIILHGEHSVVYGKMAIAAAVNGYMEVQLKHSETQHGVLFKMPDLCDKEYVFPTNLLSDLFVKCCKSGKITQDESSWKQIIKDFVADLFTESPKLVKIALTVCLFCYIKVLVCGKEPASFPSLHISATSHNLPLGAGLGSSSAFSVSLATAMLLYGQEIVLANAVCKLDSPSLSRINDLAYCLEQIVHGNPSGVDNSVSTYGGAVKFESKKLSHLDKFPELRIVVVDSGVARNTKTMVENVRKKVNEIPKVMESILSSMHEISVEAENLYHNYKESEDFDEHLKILINTNHHLLNAIEVGHQTLDDIRRISTNHGFASKLTGAGGGGCAFVYLPKDALDEKVEKLTQELARSGFKSWEVTLGCPGVTVVDVDKCSS